MFKKFFKKYISQDLIDLLRTSYRRIALNMFFKRRKTKHIYAGFPLEIYIGDHLGEQWYNCDWERKEIEFLRQNKLKTGSRVFNIGAHQCVVALILAKIVGSNGLVVAVEMDAHHISLAKINRKSNNTSNLHIIHAAVAERGGSVFFDRDQIQSRPAKWGTPKVRSISVDELTEQYCPPSLLYIDVEGYECNVLMGSKKTMQYYPDCCIEVHVGCGLEKYNGSV